MNQLKTYSEIALAYKFAAIRDIKVKVLRWVECRFIGGRAVKRIGTKNEVIFPRFCITFVLTLLLLGVSWWGRELARKVA